MGIAAVFGVVSMAKIENRLLRISVLFLVLGIIWTIVDNPYIGTSLSLYFLGFALFAVYAGITKGLSTEKRIVLLVTTIFVLAQGLFAANQLPYVYLLKALQIIPLLLFLLKIMPNRADYKAEMGALLIIATDALIQVIIYIMYLTQG